MHVYMQLLNHLQVKQLDIDSNMKPQKSASTQCNRELAQVHIAKKALGLDDETYRQYLMAIAVRCWRVLKPGAGQTSHSVP